VLPDTSDISPRFKRILASRPKPADILEVEEREGLVVLIYDKTFTKREQWAFNRFGGEKQIRRPLDEKGSFAWRLMDGTRTIGDICRLMDERFGEEIEPVMKTVNQFLELLLKLNLLTLEPGDPERIFSDSDAKGPQRDTTPEEGHQDDADTEDKEGEET